MDMGATLLQFALALVCLHLCYLCVAVHASWLTGLRYYRRCSASRAKSFADMLTACALGEPVLGFAIAMSNQLAREIDE